MHSAICQIGDKNGAIAATRIFGDFIISKPRFSCWLTMEDGRRITLI